MRIETLLALKAFIATVTTEGSNGLQSRELTQELDREIALRTLIEHERVRRIFRAGNIVDVVTLENSATPPLATEGAAP